MIKKQRLVFSFALLFALPFANIAITGKSGDTIESAVPQNWTAGISTADLEKYEEQLRQDKIDELLGFAEGLLGIRYRWGGSSLKNGMDCSGFTLNVYKTLGLELPRSSRQQANVGDPIALEEAVPGDLIVFTGTNARKRVPGHVGIVYEVTDEEVKFIHSASSKGVTINSIDNHYGKRLLEVRRVI